MCVFSGDELSALQSFTLFDDRSKRCRLLCNGFGELQEQRYTSECDVLGLS